MMFLSRRIKVADNTGAPGTPMRRHYPAMHRGFCGTQNHGGIKPRRATVYGCGIVADTSKADKQLGNANNGMRGGGRPPLY
jgi:hypothetical protein